jgi:hypothetical protein
LLAVLVVSIKRKTTLYRSRSTVVWLLDTIFITALLPFLSTALDLAMYVGGFMGSPWQTV